MRAQARLLFLLFTALPAALFAQPLADPSKPPTDAWPTYHGDYSGRHFSPLKQINSANVKGLSLAWIYRAAPLAAAAAGAPAGGGGRGATIKSLPLMIGGILYLSTANNAYSVDARTGEQLWHVAAPGGTRGMAMSGNWLFQGGGDSLVSLDMTTGKERWRKTHTVRGANYFTPVAIGNHIIVGVGMDTNDIPAWLESRDPETGDLQWQWNVTPRKGEPGLDSWPSEDAAIHGGGGPWQPVTYDPELNLVYVTTANPNPVLNPLGRPGSNLYTSSIVALHADTGKMAWYFQCSPHDTHDWDATQDAFVFDGTINGQPRKLIGQLNRNGWLFVIDRVTGKSVVSKPYITTSNSYSGTDAKGQPIPNPDKDPAVAGVLVSPDSDGAANYPAPTFSPDTGLIYVNATEAYSIFYLTSTDGKAMAWGGASEYHTGYFPSVLRALDYRTGTVKWEHKYDGIGFWSSTYPGMLSTSGNLLFTGDPYNNFVAYDAAAGKRLWRFPLGAGQTNSPISYILDGRQYVLVASNDTLYAFYLQ